MALMIYVFLFVFLWFSFSVCMVGLGCYLYTRIEEYCETHDYPLSLGIATAGFIAFLTFAIIFIIYNLIF